MNLKVFNTSLHHSKLFLATSFLDSLNYLFNGLRLVLDKGTLSKHSTHVFQGILVETAAVLVTLGELSVTLEVLLVLSDWISSISDCFHLAAKSSLENAFNLNSVI